MTIEQRAEAYANKVSSEPGYRITAKNGYMQGATEERALVEKENTKSIESLKQDFENKFDCYADTDNGLPIMAMTFDAVKELFSKYQTASLEARVKELEEVLKEIRDKHNIFHGARMLINSALNPKQQ